MSLFRCQIDEVPYVLILAEDSMQFFTGSNKMLDTVETEFADGLGFAKGQENEIGKLEYSRIRKVSGLKHGLSLQVRKKITGMKLTFPSVGEMNRFIDTLEQLSGAKRVEYLMNRVSASIVPALIVVAAMVLTAVLIAAGAAFDADADGPGLQDRQRGIVVVIYGLAAGLGPIGGGIVGALLTALTFFWFLSYWRNPPPVVELRGFEQHAN